jgi:hypothetical protein
MHVRADLIITIACVDVGKASLLVRNVRKRDAGGRHSGDVREIGSFAISEMIIAHYSER